MYKPFFSKVTLVHNGDKFLNKCIKSLINQNFKDIKYIVVDLKLTDNTNKIIKKNVFLVYFTYLDLFILCFYIQ